MVLAAVAAWAAASMLHMDTYAGALLGVVVGAARGVRNLLCGGAADSRSTRIPDEEKEIFVLTGTLLWGIMIQEFIAYFFTDNAKTAAAHRRGRGGHFRRSHATE